MMRRALLGLALGLSLVACKASAGSSDDKFGSLTVDQVSDLIAKKGADIYDNNDQSDWAEGHVPTARWVKFNGVTAKDLPQDKGRELVFYCANTH
jgi:hypothetical protein